MYLPLPPVIRGRPFAPPRLPVVKVFHAANAIVLDFITIEKGSCIITCRHDLLHLDSLLSYIEARNNLSEHSVHVRYGRMRGFTFRGHNDLSWIVVPRNAPHSRRRSRR
jgi:hypothetical protein